MYSYAAVLIGRLCLCYPKSSDYATALVTAITSFFVISNVIGNIHGMGSRNYQMEPCLRENMEYGTNGKQKNPLLRMG